MCISSPPTFTQGVKNLNISESAVPNIKLHKSIIFSYIYIFALHMTDVGFYPLDILGKYTKAYNYTPVHVYIIYVHSIK